MPLFEKGKNSSNSSVMWNKTIQLEAGVTVVISCFAYLWVFTVPFVACMAPNDRAVNNKLGRVWNEQVME